jgi:hypothetical protein
LKLGANELERSKLQNKDRYANTSI